MPRMQRPTIVFGNERPSLNYFANRERIAFDVPNRAPNLIGMIEKHFPAAIRPDWMGDGE